MRTAKDPIRPGDGDSRHGTATGYSFHRCPCDICRLGLRVRNHIYRNETRKRTSDETRTVPTSMQAERSAKRTADPTDAQLEARLKSLRYRAAHTSGGELAYGTRPKKLKLANAAERPNNLARSNRRSTGDSSFMGHAACQGMGPNMFHPEKGEPLIHAKAKAVCMGCPVRIDCAEYAIPQASCFGVWGGLSEQERRSIRVKRGMAA